MTLRRAWMVVFIPPVLAVLFALACWGFALSAAGVADDGQARLQAALKQRPQEPVVQAAALLVPGATAGLAASALQAQVLALVSGVEVQQIEARGAEPAGALTRLPVNLRLAGPEDAVMQAVIALEQAEPLIFVDALRVTAAGNGGPMAVEIDLSAYAGKVSP